MARLHPLVRFVIQLFAPGKRLRLQDTDNPVIDRRIVDVPADDPSQYQIPLFRFA